MEEARVTELQRRLGYVVVTVAVGLVGLALWGIISSGGSPGAFDIANLILGVVGFGLGINMVRQ